MTGSVSIAVAIVASDSHGPHVVKPNARLVVPHEHELGPPWLFGYHPLAGDEKKTDKDQEGAARYGNKTYITQEGQGVAAGRPHR